MRRLDFRRWLLVLSGLAALWLATLWICLLFGAQRISAGEASAILWSGLIPGTADGGNGTSAMILLDIRLPRVLLAGLVGGTLAAVGVALQALLRNPLADPFVIGISSGTALGVVLSLWLGLNFSLAGFSAGPLFGFLGGLAALFFLNRLAQAHGKIMVHTLLLAGVILNAMLSAVILLITYLADADRVIGIVYWLMGNLGSLGMATVMEMFVFLLIGISILLSSGRGLNLLALGEETAASLGLEAERTKKKIFLAAALLTGAVVSVSGMISFVGIMVPHVLRFLVGPDHRILLPASVLGGGIFLMAADTAARTLIAPTEIPVGVITALCGGPFFLYLLGRERKNMFQI